MDVTKTKIGVRIVGFMLFAVCVILVIITLKDVDLDNHKERARSRQIATSMIWTDPETGCEYLSNAGMTPRLDRNGKHICR